MIKIRAATPEEAKATSVNYLHIPWDDKRELCIAAEPGKTPEEILFGLFDWVGRELKDKGDGIQLIHGFTKCFVADLMDRYATLEEKSKAIYASKLSIEEKYKALHTLYETTVKSIPELIQNATKEIKQDNAQKHQETQKDLKDIKRTNDEILHETSGGARGKAPTDKRTMSRAQETMVDEAVKLYKKYEYSVNKLSQTACAKQIIAVYKRKGLPCAYSDTLEGINAFRRAITRRLHGMK